MTISEFSDQFDVELSSYGRFKKFDNQEVLDSIEVNEYEKSIYLTKAQEQLVIGLYTGRNEFGLSYEHTEELRRYLEDLNITETIDIFETFTDGSTLVDNSKVAQIPYEVLFITQEQCNISSTDVCKDGTWVECTPLRRDDYNRVKNNPFRNNKVWRVDMEHGAVELISKHNIQKYRISYLNKPTPIILEDITPLSIEGKSKESNTNLHPILHNKILELAVQYAIRDIASRQPREDN